MMGALHRKMSVVIPPPARKHGHPRVSRMKALVPSLMWWPGIDHEIEDMVQHCTECQQTQVSPPSAPLHPWKGRCSILNYVSRFYL